ncbi:MAG TPA: GTP cyclohydrolase II [Anaerolineaceae bacterium]|nr:GTP cyclohydrolase II [Anaerolineaceae bacterium]
MPDDLEIHRAVCARVPTAVGEFQLCLYTNNHDKKEHLAFINGDVDDQSSVLVRVHSECFTGDVLGSQRCDCGDQLHRSMELIALEGRGVIIYLRQEGRGIGLAEKLRAYNLQDEGLDTVDANLALGHSVDERDYSMAAAILKDLGVKSVRMITNNPDKIVEMENRGIKIDERIALMPTVTADNAAYLLTKIQRMNHLLELDPFSFASIASRLDARNGQH